MTDTLASATGLGPDELRAAVRDRYAGVATHPEGSYSFRVGRAFAVALGYPPELLDTVPAGATVAFTGVAAPVLQSDLRPGETILDLGCGGGLDLILAARAVGPPGRAIGLDMARSMATRARASLREARLERADVIVGFAEALPLAGVSIDCVVANGILNLAPDKSAILAEVARVLRPGGRFILAETTLRAELPPGSVQSLEDWFR